MTEPTEKGVLVTTKSITTIMSLIGIMVAVFSGVSIVNSYSYRIDRVEAVNVQFSSSLGQLTEKMDLLNKTVVDLTIALNRVQDRYERLEKGNQ